MANRRQRPTDTSWEGVAEWYRELSGRRGPELVSRVLHPEILRMLGRVRGRSVLDVGCGPGAWARLLAYRGAQVVGVDASPQMVELASRDAEAAGLEPGPRFVSADAAKLGALPRGPFDIATLVLSLQNMERPEPVLRNVARSLRRGGRLAVALNHPCFRNPGVAHWGWDAARQTQFRRIESYRSERRVEIQIHPGRDPGVTRPSFHWSLERLFGALRAAGFVVLDLSEPVSDRVSSGGRAEAENRARREIPLFVVLLAERSREPRRRGRPRRGSAGIEPRRARGGATDGGSSGGIARRHSMPRGCSARFSEGRP
ncbi:MAG: class I SAM-dependent methyltransferase [Myxococcota bacterium]